MCFNLIESLYLLQKGNLVYYDALTGVKSRQYYDMKARSKYLRREVLVAFVDVDNLKEINDTYGHTSGSKLLKEIADKLSNIEGVEDVCRIGGDEFILLGAFDGNALNDIDNISYGTYLKEPYEDMSSAVKKADERMYASKTMHRMEHGQIQKCKRYGTHIAASGKWR